MQYLNHKSVLILFLELIFCLNIGINHTYANDAKCLDSNLNEIEIELEYFGWRCHCPQWITPENKKLYLNNLKKDKPLNADGLFWEIEAADPSLKSPLELQKIDGIEDYTMTYKFVGEFYESKQKIVYVEEIIETRVFRYTSVERVFK